MAELVHPADRTPQQAHGIAALSQAALVCGMSDVLTTAGVEAAVIGGVSLGSLIGATLAGAVDRRELFELLYHQRHLPHLPDDAPAQGMAIANLSAAQDPASYYGDRWPGVFLAADHGGGTDGNNRLIVLSGHLPALQAVADAHPNTIRMLDSYFGALHSPLAQYIADFMDERISTMTFRAPEAVLCSPFTGAPVSTAEGVREYFVQNFVTASSVCPILDEMARLDCRDVVGLGPGTRKDIAAGPLRVRSALSAEGLREVVESLAVTA
ncbi:hypothetical protein [Nocardia sp. CC201C]|uniref:hypothetical protein n=1 Tax=Nocardia sp. CC201C TaxID=3044575 RepID=UPI0024A7DAC9|nr:hypothetical protein [Nocardia sp. CC201C]